MAYCLDHLEDISVFIGTHNEMSNYLALQIMEVRILIKMTPEFGLVSYME